MEYYLGVTRLLKELLDKFGLVLYRDPGYYPPHDLFLITKEEAYNRDCYYDTYSRRNQYNDTIGYYDY